MAKTPVLHPILGARRHDQVQETLAAADLVLPKEIVDRLDEATDFELGFPHDFITDMQTFVFGEVNRLVDR